MDKKKILHISSGMAGGGASSVFSKTYSLLENLGEFDNYLVSTNIECGDKCLNLIDIKESNKILKPLNYLYCVKNKRLLKDFIKEVEPDIIHSHNVLSCLSASVLSVFKFAKKRYGTRLILTAHEFHPVCPNSSLYNYRKDCVCEECVGSNLKFKAFSKNCTRYGFVVSFLKYLRFLIYGVFINQNRLFDKIITVSDFEKQIFIKDGISEKKVLTINNPIENKFLSNGNVKKEKVLTFFGRLSREKNIETIIEAFSLLQKMEGFEDFKLQIIGSGEELDFLKNFVKKLEIIDKVVFIAHLKAEELKSYVEKSYATVLASKLYETYGLVIVESIFANTIPIVSNIGALKSTVDDTFGVLFETGNSFDLKEKMVYTIENQDELFSKMKSLKPEIIKKVSSDNYLKQLKRVYEGEI